MIHSRLKKIKAASGLRTVLKLSQYRESIVLCKHCKRMHINRPFLNRGGQSKLSFDGNPDHREKWTLGRVPGTSCTMNASSLGNLAPAVVEDRTQPMPRSSGVTQQRCVLLPNDSGRSLNTSSWQLLHHRTFLVSRAL